MLRQMRIITNLFSLRWDSKHNLSFPLHRLLGHTLGCNSPVNFNPICNQCWNLINLCMFILGQSRKHIFLRILSNVDMSIFLITVQRVKDKKIISKQLKAQLIYSRSGKMSRRVRCNDYERDGNKY